MSKKTIYNLITILILIGSVGLVVGMIKAYEIECAKQGGTTTIAKTNIRGISMGCKK